MTGDLDLFGQYPFRAGYRDQDTSRDAAIAIETSGRAEALRHAVLRELSFPATGKEVAKSLGIDPTSIRPRITEMKARGLIYDTGLRRNGEKIWQTRGGHSQ